MWDYAQQGVELGFIGEKGRAVMLAERDSFELATFGPPGKGGVERTEVPSGIPEDVRKLSHGGGVYYELLDFVENVRTGCEPLTGIEAAKWSTLVGLAAEESARKGGQPVTF
jgi:hypothetical protein